MPRNRSIVISLLIVAALCSVAGPLLLSKVGTEAFKPLLALMTLVSLPFLFVKPRGAVAVQPAVRIGWPLLALVLLVSSFITASVFSIIMTLILLRCFRLTTLQSVAVRRVIGTAQSVVIFIVLSALGNFLWQHALAGILGGLIGSYMGTHLAIKGGERFATYALATGAILSTIVLLS